VVVQSITGWRREGVDVAIVVGGPHSKAPSVARDHNASQVFESRLGKRTVKRRVYPKAKSWSDGVL